MVTVNAPDKTINSPGWAPPIRTEISGSKRIILIPTNTTIRREWYLAYPVIAEEEITRDGIILRSNEFDEEAYGATLETAYWDLLTSMSDRFASLARRAEHLADSEQKLLQKLQGLLSRTPILSGNVA